MGIDQLLYLRNLVDHPSLSGQFETQTDLLELALTLDPTSKEFKSRFVAACRKAISNTYSTRRFEDFEKYLVKIRPYDPIHEQFFRLSSRQFLKADVDEAEWRSLLGDAVNKKSDLIKRIHSGLIVKLIHAEKLSEALQEFKIMLDSDRFSSHDLRLTIALLRLALKKNCKEEIFEIQSLVKRKNIDRDLRGFARLKFFEVLSEIQYEKGGAPHGLWKNMLKLLKNTPTTRENKNYIDRLDFIFNELDRKHRLLLDIRIAPADKIELQKIIENAIEQQKPFSLLRLGDADSYGLDTVEFDRKIFMQDCEARERKWWGINLDSELRRKIDMMFKQTLQDSDVVGIPSIFRFVSDLPDPWTSFLGARNQRGSVVVMDSVHDLSSKELISKPTIFTDNRCHYVLFDLKSANQLAQQAKKTIVVSHYVHDRIQAVFSSNVSTIQIPGEGGGVNSLPYQIDEITKNLREQVTAGTVVFVAAGFAGKYLLKMAKDCGAVALDVGAMADYWVGIKSRGLELV